jgi:hypothetical protein
MPEKEYIFMDGAVLERRQRCHEYFKIWTPMCQT